MEPKTADRPGEQRRGRPRDERADSQILAAAEALLREGGVEAVTMSAVVARSGVARATVYRRWPNRDALVAAIARRAMGRPPIQVRDDALGALDEAGRMAADVLRRPAMKGLLPTLIRGVLADEDAPGRLSYDQVIPGRRRFAESYRRGAAADGLRTDVDGELVADLLLGGMMQHLIATGQGPDDATARQAIDIVLNGLRPRPDKVR